MTAEQIVSLVTGGATAATVLGLWIALFITGKIHTDSEFQGEVKRGELKDQTIRELRAAIEAANERAVAAVKASELIAGALTSAGQRRGRGPAKES